jgi:hypothetical protein
MARRDLEPKPRAPTGADAAPAIGVLERNRTVLARASRIVRAASGLLDVAADEDPAGLRAQLAADTRALVCHADDLELVLAWCQQRYPMARVITWSTGPMAPLIDAAHDHPRVLGVLGWPSFQSMPRAWEIALAVRHALAPAREPLHITELFAGAPVATKYKPRTSADRDAFLAELANLAERAGAPPRITAKIGEVAHELLMNAMYDAPVNHYGEPRYAHDRRASVELDDHEVPTARFATDGNLIAVQVADPFGRLTRAHVLAGIRRGQRASADRQAGAPDADPIIDASYGGAGLGLWKIYAGSAATIVDVIPGQTTSVTAVFDLDVGPREMRTMPPSLHLFDRSEL